MSNSAKFAEFQFASKSGKIATRAASPFSFDEVAYPDKLTNSPANEAFESQNPGNQPGNDAQQVNAPFFPQAQPRGDLLITLKASTLLTELISAVVSGPGDPADADVLDRLIGQAHLLADGWAKQIAGPDESPPEFLRANLLKQACRFLARQWQSTGSLDAQRALDLGSDAFSAQISGVNQRVLDLFDQAPDKPSTDPLSAQQEIQATCSKAYWNLAYAVTSIKATEYGLAGLVDDVQDRFLYGKRAEDIVDDLLECVLQIADENHIKPDNPELAVTWYRNALNRLTTLMSANYKTITRMVVAEIDAHAPDAPARVKTHFGMYDQVLERCYQIVRKQFTNAEQVATEKIGNTAFMRYLQAAQSKDERLNTHSQNTDFVSADTPSNQPHSEQHSNTYTPSEQPGGFTF